MDERAADSLFGAPDDGHDFFTSLDGANTSPNQSVQEPAVQYSQSVPVDSYAAVPYSSTPPALTAQANDSPDPYAQVASHAQAASSQDPYAPPYASHSATAYQPTRGIPSQPAATPYAPNTTPAATSSMTTPAYDPYASMVTARPAATTSYIPPHSYNATYTSTAAAAPSPYTHLSLVPPPPAPKTVDASQFRVKPNAYDPPIRDVLPARSAPRILSASTYNTQYSPPASHPYAPQAYAAPPSRTPSIPPPPPTRMTPPPHQSSQVHPPPMHRPSTSQPPKVIPPPPAHRNSPDLSSPALTSSTSHLSTHVHGMQHIPRTSSPLVPRPMSGTGSPRPSSVASNKSVHSPPPRAPSVVSSTASQSRPSSAASNPYAPQPRSRPSISSASPVESSGRVSTKLPSPTSLVPPPGLVPPLEIEEPLATARPNGDVNPFNVIPPSSINLASYKQTLGSPLSEASALPNTTSPPPNLYHDESRTSVESKPEEHRLDSLEDPDSAFGTVLPQPYKVDELVVNDKVRIPSPPSDPYAPIKPVQSVPIPRPVAQPPVDPYARVLPHQPMDPFAHTHNRQPTDSSHTQRSTDPYAPRQDRYSSAVSIVSGPPRRQTLEGFRTPPPAPASVLDLTHSPSPPRAVKPPGQATDPYAVPSGGPYQPVAPPPMSTGTYQPVSTYQPMQPPLLAYQPMQPVQPVPSLPQPVYEPPAEQYATVPSTLSSSLHNMYAPSPSLLGTNDPLGRTALRVPVVSFGFGGKLVLCFHKNPAEAGGFDTAMSARPATQISFKPIKGVVPSSMLSTQTQAGTPFPGPLFCDQATAAAGVLAGAAANTKAKKAALLQWFDELAAEAERDVGYVGNDSVVGRAKAEGKSVLIKLLKVFVENDGKLAGSPTVEAAVRTALLGAAPVTGDMPTHSFGYPGSGEPGLDGHPTAVATYQVKPASLDRLQELLIWGESRKAYQFASDEKMWAHALLIASSLDKAAWKEVVSEFIQAELGVIAGMDAPINAPSANKKESLRVAYGLIAGDSAAALKQLVPPRLLGQGPQMNMLAPGRPVSPTHASAAPTNVPIDALVQWKEVLAAIYSNHNVGDDTPLTALGDQLVAKQWIEAAHCCYLLSSGLSSISGTACPAPRVALFGSEHPAQARTFHTDLLPVALSEVAEYGLSLTPPLKGQEPYPGLPHLQAYRLWHAACLTETGDISLALRYTEAITATLRLSTRASPYFTPTFVEQLKDIHDRLTGAPHGDKKNFLSKAITKPSMETFNTWIAGGLTKLIEGDESNRQPPDQQVEAKPVNGATLGPFSHYSAISNAPSKSPSPAPSFTSVHGMSTIPPPRTASSGGYCPPANGLSLLPVAPPPPRSESAMDYTQTINRKPSPRPKVFSANAATTTFSQAHENGHTPYNSDQMNWSSVEDVAKGDAGSETGLWWGSSNGATTASATPTAASFLRVNAVELPEGEGPQFISLGDSDSLFTPSVTPSIAPSSPRFATEPSSYDEDDDLGLGNSKPKKKKSVEVEDDPESISSGPPKTDTKAAPDPPPPKAEHKKEEAKPQSGTTSGSWFGWFKKSDTPKPVKANLGKESSFYYDPDLGRWVNKAAGASDTTPKASAPPPRAQTASPGRSATGAVSPATATPLPPRAASAVPSSSGVAPPPRPSSTLSGANSLTASGPPPPSRLPTDAPPKAGTPPLPRTMGQTPPPGGPMASGTAKPVKRNPRSRYVDVFQQQT